MVELLVTAVSVVVSIALVTAVAVGMARLSLGLASRRIALILQLALFAAGFVVTRFQQSRGRWDDPGLWYAMITTLVLVLYADLALGAILLIRYLWRRPRG